MFFSLNFVDISLFIAFCVGCFYWYFTATFDYWKKKGVPFPPPTVFFGNSKRTILREISLTEHFLSVYSEFPQHKFVGLFSSRTPTLIIRDPDIIQQVLIKDFVYFHDRSFPINEKTDPLSAHLFALRGDRWRKVRTKVTPAFTSGKMKIMFEAMSECAVELNNFLEKSAVEQKVLEMREVCSKFTTDIIGTCAFGLQFNSIKDENSKFREMGRKIFDQNFIDNLLRVIVFFLPRVANFFQIPLTPTDVSNFFLSMVKKTVEYREKNNIARKDFLQILIDLRNKSHLEGNTGSTKNEDTDLSKARKKEDDIELTDNLLAAQCFVFFVAGFETSATTMSFCLYELALNPVIQDKVRREIDEVLHKHGGKMTYKCVQDMEYLGMTIDETLRKYPPIPVLSRVCTKPYTIPGTDVQLDQGVRVLIPICGIQMDPQYFPEPEKFDPERFTESNRKSRPHFVYLPFGEGPRMCIGMRFGLMQTRVGLASLLSRYEFSTTDETCTTHKFDTRGFVMAFKGGVKLKISPRR